jgi:hypothetical protein
LSTPQQLSLAGIPVRNTSNLITKDTKICSLCFAGPGFGKTTLSATLDKMTKRFFGKPTLIIAVEAGEGGGTMSIQEAGVDFVTPTSMSELRMVIASLQADTIYGGVVLDSGTEYAKSLAKKTALKMPSKDKSPAASRAEGVPDQGDYNVLGEMIREDFHQLIKLTCHPNLNVRKHLMVTALVKEQQDRKTQDIISVHPDLPGHMGQGSPALFQTSMSMVIQAKVMDGKRINQRVLLTQGNNVLKVRDRTGCVPDKCEADWEKIWEKYWIPRIEGRSSAVGEVA